MAPLLTVVLAISVVPAAPQDVQSVITANNQFAADVYQHLRGQDGNLFFSPYSINKTLAMVHAGAAGDTAREMNSVLHLSLSSDEQHRAFLDMRKLLNQPVSGKPGVQLLMSANVWGQRGYHFETAYLNLLQECYGAGLQQVDFTNPEPARQTINNWVDKQTQHRIQDLFQPGTIGVNTRLVLASAIYFKGNWVHRFQKSDTRSLAFHSDATSSVPVPMMRQTDSFGYFENERMQALQLPYEGKDWALVVLLPKRGHALADLEKDLAAESLATWTAQLREQKVDVTLPKWKLTSAMDLNGTLQGLGMRKAFGGEADFSKMNGGREPLYVSTVAHKAFVDVNEEGTEAAAATGAAMRALSMPVQPAPVPVFRADHPFIFAIQHAQTGVVLFLGRVVKP